MRAACRARFVPEAQNSRRRQRSCRLRFFCGKPQKVHGTPHHPFLTKPDRDSIIKGEPPWAIPAFCKAVLFGKSITAGYTFCLKRKTKGEPPWAVPAFLNILLYRNKKNGRVTQYFCTAPTLRRAACGRAPHQIPPFTSWNREINKV